MATLYVRNVPDDVYRALRKRAARRDSTISAEAVTILRQALTPDGERLRAFIDEVSKRPLRPAPSAPSPAELIRADREQR